MAIKKIQKHTHSHIYVVVVVTKKKTIHFIFVSCLPGRMQQFFWQLPLPSVSCLLLLLFLYPVSSSKHTTQTFFSHNSNFEFPFRLFSVELKTVFNAVFRYPTTVHIERTISTELKIRSIVEIFPSLLGQIIILFHIQCCAPNVRHVHALLCCQSMARFCCDFCCFGSLAGQHCCIPCWQHA